jgi:hypothetical protein
VLAGLLALALNISWALDSVSTKASMDLGRGKLNYKF